MFDVIDEITTALDDETLSPAQRMNMFNAQLSNIDDALDKMNESRSALGVDMKNADLQRKSNDSRTLDYQEINSKLEDADLVEAISQYQFESTVYQAALKSFSQTSQLSLFNFI